MLSSKLTRSVSIALCRLEVLCSSDIQLPRATLPFLRPSIRLPAVSSFARFQSNGGEEKVKGAVIGIDLGRIERLLRMDMQRS